MKRYLITGVGLALIAGCGNNLTSAVSELSNGGSDSLASSTSQNDSSTVEIRGTVPGTKIEAYCADGSYSMVHSVNNGTSKHPFTIKVPKNTACQLVMTTNENDKNTMLVTKVAINGHKQLKFSGSVDVGNVSLPFKHNAGADVHDSNNDHVNDKVFDINVKSDKLKAADGEKNKFDKDGDGEIDTLQDKDHNGKADEFEDRDGNGEPDALEDKNCDGIPDIEDDLDHDGKPDLMEDKDHDGTPDNLEDKDHNGIPDSFDDTNHDGIPDGLEDYDGNGIPDYLEDKNHNDVPDHMEDKNHDGIPDDMEHDGDEDDHEGGKKDDDGDDRLGGANVPSGGVLCPTPTPAPLTPPGSGTTPGGNTPPTPGANPPGSGTTPGGGTSLPATTEI